MNKLDYKLEDLTFRALTNPEDYGVDEGWLIYCSDNVIVNTENNKKYDEKNNVISDLDEEEKDYWDDKVSEYLTSL